VADPFEQKVYLRSLGDTAIHTRYSAGAQRRAAQLGQFIATLQETAASHLTFKGKPDLLVVKRRDWQKLFSYPYGFAFARARKRGADKHVTIVAAADYPERLMHRFDAVKVKAAKEGILPPGELREFFDLFIGQQWGHAALTLAGLRTRIAWLDDLLAAHLFLLVLKDLGWNEMAERFLTWSDLQLAGSSGDPLPLRDFSYPRAKVKFERGLWFQGILTKQANHWAEQHGWALASHLGSILPISKPQQLISLLEDYDAAFASWLESFDNALQEDESA